MRRGALAWALLLLLAGPATAGEITVEFAFAPPAPTEDDEIQISVSGIWPDSCVPMDAQAAVDVGLVVVETASWYGLCPLVLTPWSESVVVGPLAADTYDVVSTNRIIPGPPEELGRTVLVVPEPTQAPSVVAALFAALVAWALERHRARATRSRPRVARPRPL